MKEQLLTEIKEDLKGCGKNFSSGNAPYICGKDKWIDGYSLCPICKERVKAYHRMANLWLDDANSKQIVYWDENHQDWEWDYDKKLIKELLTLIQEIEKIAKEQNIDLSQQVNPISQAGEQSKAEVGRPKREAHGGSVDKTALADTKNQTKQENIELK